MTQIVVAYTSNAKKRIQFFQVLQSLADNWKGYVGQHAIHSCPSPTTPLYDEQDGNNLLHFNSSGETEEPENRKQTNLKTTSTTVSLEIYSSTCSTKSSCEEDAYVSKPIPVTVKLVPLFSDELNDSLDKVTSTADDDCVIDSNSIGSNNNLHVHAVLHKRTDDMAQSILYQTTSIKSEQRLSESDDTTESSEFQNKKSAAQKRVKHLASTLASTEAFVIDNIPGIWKLLDRRSIANTIDEILPSFSIPWLAFNASELNDPSDFGELHFPVIIKRRLACGTMESHDMVIAHNASSALFAVRKVFRGSAATFKSKERAGEQPRPHRRHANGGKDFGGIEEIAEDDIVVQEFIPDHGGVLFKVYAIGDRVVVKPRNSVDINSDTMNHTLADSKEVSLPVNNEDYGGETRSGFTRREEYNQYHYFNSQTLNRKHKAMRNFRKLSGERDQDDFTIFDDVPGKSAQTRAIMPSEKLARNIVGTLNEHLQLSLLGVDMIYDMENRRYFVIDVNFFPSYKDVPKAHEWLLQHICDKVWEAGRLS